MTTSARDEMQGALHVFADANAVAVAAAEKIADPLRTALTRFGKASLALSGGNTPRAAYGLLGKMSGIRWDAVDVFWVDERAVPPTDERSNYRHASEMLLVPGKIPPARIHRMPADANSLEDAAKEYERVLRSLVATDNRGVPAFDVMVLGIGDDGHTASLFPGEPTVLVADRLTAAVKARGEREARLTLTTPVIQAARHLLVLAVGSGKRPALERAWKRGGDLNETPVRLVREAHGDLVWLTDEAATPP